MPNCTLIFIRHKNYNVTAGSRQRHPFPLSTIAAVLNLWAAAHWWAADLCLVGRDQGWELRIFLCESHVTIHEKVPSLGSA